MIEGIKKLRSDLENLPPQLYVQAVCTFELLNDLLQTTTLYYVQRSPEELGDFKWRIDAKDKKVTPYERLWTTIVLPMIQSKSFSEPFAQLVGADYSYFSRFCETTDLAPEHIRPFIKTPSPFEYISIREVLGENVCFEQSHSNLGVQMIDILTTSLRRAMNGKLGIDGWGGGGGKLMVSPLRRKQVIHLVDITGDGMTPYLEEKSPPFHQVFSIVDQSCKPILVDTITTLCP